MSPDQASQPSTHGVAPPEVASPEVDMSISLYIPIYIGPALHMHPEGTSQGSEI